MKHWIACCTLALCSAVSQAEDLSGLRIVGATGKQLTLFADQDGRSKLRDIPSSEVAKLNLVVRRDVGDFAEITFDGQTAWVDVDRIRLERRAPDCIRIANSSHEIRVAGTRGAADQRDCR